VSGRRSFGVIAAQICFVAILRDSLSNEYLLMMWTVLEQQAIVHEFLKRQGKDYVLPIRVRGCLKNIPELSGLTGFITVKTEIDWSFALMLPRRKLLISRLELALSNIEPLAPGLTFRCERKVFKATLEAYPGMRRSRG
jgi:hypothetical protein